MKYIVNENCIGKRVYILLIIAAFICLFVPAASQVYASTSQYDGVIKEYRDLVNLIDNGKIRNMSDYYHQDYNYISSEVARCAIEGNPSEGTPVGIEYALADIDQNGSPELIIGSLNKWGEMNGYSIGCIATLDTRGKLYWPAVSSSFMYREGITVYEDGTIEVSGSGGAQVHNYTFLKINVYRPGVEVIDVLDEDNGEYLYNGESIGENRFYQIKDQLENKALKELTWEVFCDKTSTEEDPQLASYYDIFVNGQKRFAFPQYEEYIKGINTAGDKSLIVPGLRSTNVSGRSCKNMVPQGICYDGTHYLISAYCFDGSHNSVFYVLDSSGQYVCTIDLGIKSHVGSISCNTVNKKVYIADCFAETLRVDIKDQIGCVLQMDVSNITSACTIHNNYNKDCISLLSDLDVDLSDTEHLLFRVPYHADYINCTSDSIWVGTFKNNIPILGRDYGYFSNYMKQYDYKGNLKQDKFVLGNSSQGVRVFSGEEKYKDHAYVFNSCTGDLRYFSNLNIYFVYEDSLSGTNDLFYPYPPSRFSMPVLSEDLEAVGSNLYTVYEAGANQYRNHGVAAGIKPKLPMGRVTCANLDSLISSAHLYSPVNRGNGSPAQDGNDFIIDQGACGEDLAYYLYNDGTLNICGTGEMYDYSPDDPAPWQANQDMIKEIYIGENVTTVGEYAFYGCEKAELFNVSKFTNSDQQIILKDMALADCKNLQTVNLPKAEYTVSDSAFLNDDAEIRTDTKQAAVQLMATGQSTHVHQWRYQETVPPDCAAYGYDRYTCSCGEEKLGYAVEPTEDHKFKEVDRVKATYASGGEINYECTVCGETASRQLAKLTMAGKAISKIVKGKRSMTVKWKKRTKKEKSTIKGYQLRYSLSKNFTKSKTKTKTVRASATKVKIKKMKSKKTYYVQLRTYAKENGVKYYSKWSKTKKVKIK